MLLVQETIDPGDEVVVLPEHKADIKVDQPKYFRQPN